MLRNRVVDDDFGVLLREVGDVGHLLDERRFVRLPSVTGWSLVGRALSRTPGAGSTAQPQSVRRNHSSGKTTNPPATGPATAVYATAAILAGQRVWESTVSPVTQ